MKPTQNKNSFSKNKLALIIAGTLSVGVLLGWQIQSMSGHGGMHANGAQSDTDKQPLYWVAPMDASYRRDGPGKSPMGMDLVPVYEESGASADPAGTVRIDPSVVQNLGVRTVAVSQGPLEQSINSLGVIEFNPELQWQVNLRVSGWVDALKVNRVGERVKKGAPLFALYSPQWVKAQQEYLDALSDGRRHMIQAAYNRLIALGVDVESIAQLKKERQVSRSLWVRAPADGVIGDLAIVEGAYVAPQQMLLRAGSLNTVWVQAEVFEQQGYLIQTGDPVTMRVPALPGQRWQGRVDYRYPVVDGKTRAQTLRLVFENPDQTLLPNMYAALEIKPAGEANMLRVPRQAVIEDGHMSRVVLALGDGKYRSVRIEKAGESQDWVGVKQGLTLGQQVVTSAQFLLDSESSKSADFSRIEGAPDRQWVTGSVSAATDSPQQWILSHGPVSAWQWPAMVMPFTVADGVDTSVLKVGMPIRFAIEKQGDDYWIAEFDWQYQGAEKQTTMSSDGMNHDNMDHSQMDHAQMGHAQTEQDEMDHSQMGRSQMNHAQMDHAQMEQGEMDHSQMEHSQMNNSQMDHSQMDHGEMNHSAHEVTP
ncbi:hypothetical protein VST7929_03126 [Vibrio stylophorae]|uniref:Efflux RND transporter periplasmic adaptor subunit n=1 Tax=Vibrio stylophorae TaxID=659351 RepID=A0ABM8ZY47_9VIBR|nr:efflux RND transporter periplasmic adaptor subunit [Vibrio stylophorae]CAH0535582.1 hypothetical protein VST7929_03126 [Vibrio stylophorae]